MLSHTRHSSNIIKHINIVSSVHKNYSKNFNGFLLIFQNYLARHWVSNCVPKKKPEKRLFIHKYLSTKLLIVSKQGFSYFLSSQDFKIILQNRSWFFVLDLCWKYRELFGYLTKKLLTTQVAVKSMRKYLY